MTFSPITLAVFRDLLNQVKIAASADNFDEIAANVSLAKRELAAAIAEISEDT